MKAQICSREVDEYVGPFLTEEGREVDLLRRQNATFKRDLAIFRRENGSLKKAMEQLTK